ncbi:TadE/TadG family type IV pilus assembly protein [Amnibacterium kyonggiense]
MTAEFAVAVPAVLLVLAACLGGLRIGVERLRVDDAAAQGARAAAVGRPAPAAGVVVTERRGDTVCVTVQRAVPLLGLPVPVRATACALAGLAP